MKKVNLLIIILYINTLILAIIDSYFFSSFIGIVARLIIKINDPKIPEASEKSFLYDNFWIVFLTWLILFVVLALINIASLIIDSKKNNTEKLFNKMKRIKLALIPYWVLNFVLYIPLSAVLLLAGHGFGFLIVPVFIFASFVVLIFTSFFSIAYLYRLLKNNTITKKQFALNTILQFFFVIDIIDTLYIIKKWGKQN